MKDRTAETTPLEAAYAAAEMRFRLACNGVEAAEDERDAARRECERLEREMGVGVDG